MYSPSGSAASLSYPPALSTSASTAALMCSGSSGQAATTRARSGSAASQHAGRHAERSPGCKSLSACTLASAPCGRLIRRSWVRVPAGSLMPGDAWKCHPLTWQGVVAPQPLLRFPALRCLTCSEGLQLSAGYVERWWQRRAALAKRREGRRQQRRFRHAPGAYLNKREDLAIQLGLPA
jgi:hypothetical protein